MGYAKDSPSWMNYHGFTVSISHFSRLILEVIRGTYQYRKLKAFRPASERTNSNDLCILSKPKVRGLKKAGVLGQMAVIVVLFKRIARFIARVTVAFRKEIRNNRSPPHRVSLPGPKVPQFILTLIQGE
jgi:hypothetical protein